MQWAAVRIQFSLRIAPAQWAKSDLYTDTIHGHFNDDLTTFPLKIFDWKATWRLPQPYNKKKKKGEHKQVVIDIYEIMTLELSKNGI